MFRPKRIYAEQRCMNDQVMRYVYVTLDYWYSERKWDSFNANEQDRVCIQWSKYEKWNQWNFLFFFSVRWKYKNNNEVLQLHITIAYFLRRLQQNETNCGPWKESYYSIGTWRVFLDERLRCGAELPYVSDSTSNSMECNNPIIRWSPQPMLTQ